MDLIAAMRVEYGRSKRAHGWTWLLTAILYVVGIASVFASSIILGVASIIVQIGLFILRHVGSRHFNVAEQIRRAAMLQDGLDLKPSEIEIAKLREIIGGRKDTEPEYLGPYYESKLPKGAKRLLELTAESAFFTVALSRASALMFGTIALLGLLVIILGLVIVIQAGVSQPALDAIARITVISMLFWATGDIASMSLRFCSLSQAAGRVVDRCDNALSRSGELRDEALLAFGEYNCSVLQAPPIPAIVYKRRRDVLNEAWRKRRSEKGAN